MSSRPIATSCPGPNWHPEESWPGETFRWASNDGTIFVPALNHLDREVTLDFEPASILGGTAMQLHVVDAGGDTVASFLVSDREELRFTLPGRRWPAVHELKLHSEKVAVPIDGDPRALTYRLFGVTSRELPQDIFPVLAPFRVGVGWYKVESFGDDVFRWSMPAPRSCGSTIRRRHSRWKSSRGPASRAAGARSSRAIVSAERS